MFESKGTRAVKQERLFSLQLVEGLTGYMKTEKMQEDKGIVWLCGKSKVESMIHNINLYLTSPKKEKSKLEIKLTNISSFGQQSHNAPVSFHKEIKTEIALKSVGRFSLKT